MTSTFAAGVSRQTVILMAIAGLHLGAFILVASGIGPRVLKFEAPDPPITFILPKVTPTVVVAPDTPTPAEDYVLTVAEPDPRVVPDFDGMPVLPSTSSEPPVSDTGRDFVDRMVDLHSPMLRTRDSRLAAAIDACYPAASRRAGEEGRVVARIVIDAGGKATAWSVVRTSGFPRLDAALDCVIRRIEFVAGRRGGSAVAAEALLPIVFRMN